MSDSELLFTTPVLGFRTWWPVGSRLLSFGGYEWSRGENVAACRWSSGRHRHPAAYHHAPHHDCRCGLYSFTELGSLGNSPLVGTIAAWGDVELHYDGCRAERACITALAYQRHPTSPPAIWAIADRYRVPLVHPDALEAAGRRYAEPIEDVWIQLAVVLVVDCSIPTGGGALAATTLALRHFIGAVEPATASLIAFGDHAEAVFNELTASRPRALRAAQWLVSARRPPDLDAALAGARRMLTTANARVRRVVVVVSARPPRDVHRAASEGRRAQHERIELLAVGIGHANRMLQEVTGRDPITATPETIEQVLAELAASLSAGLPNPNATAASS